MKCLFLVSTFEIPHSALLLHRIDYLKCISQHSTNSIINKIITHHWHSFSTLPFPFPSKERDMHSLCICVHSWIYGVSFSFPYFRRFCTISSFQMCFINLPLPPPPPYNLQTCFRQQKHYFLQFNILHVCLGIGSFWVYFVGLVVLIARCRSMFLLRNESRELFIRINVAVHLVQLWKIQSRGPCLIHENNFTKIFPVNKHSEYFIKYKMSQTKAPNLIRIWNALCVCVFGRWKHCTFQLPQETHSIPLKWM